jgi:hypothetical protein
MRRDIRGFVGLLALVAAGCQSPLVLERALIGPEEVAKAALTDRALNSREGQPPPAGTPWFVVVPGSVPVVVTAPHATRPRREGMYRFSDGGGTAALAELLHDRCGVTALYTTQEGPSDPNYYDDNAFKVALAGTLSEQRPRLVLDIHGSNPARPYDVDLGTMSGRSLLGDSRLVEDLAQAFQREGLTNLSRDFFAGSKHATIVKFASARGVPAVQLEFNALRIRPGACVGPCTATNTVPDPVAQHAFAKTAQALVRFLGRRGLCSAAGSTPVSASG